MSSDFLRLLKRTKSVAASSKVWYIEGQTWLLGELVEVEEEIDEEVHILSSEKVKTVGPDGVEKFERWWLF